MGTKCHIFDASFLFRIYKFGGENENMDKTKRVLMIISMLCVITLVIGLVVFLNEESWKTKEAGAQEIVSEKEIDEDGKVHNANLSAFLKDEDFFDKEDTQTKEITEEESEKKLSLIVTSVEKDLRIKVVDEDNTIVEGQLFQVSVNETVYEDEDEDGIIYVSDLKPGRYQVKLLPIEGFHVPETELEARVKAVVSYTLIDDISYLVHAESEVDVEADDTESQDAEIYDSDETQYTNLLDPAEVEDAVSLGIDVSKWNGEIDWEAVKADGVEFAIIRCGYRGASSGWLIEDPYFWQNLQGAKAAGLKVGLYFFTQAISAKEAVEEASTVISLLGEETIDYPVYIDVEGVGGTGRADGLDAVTRTAVCAAFCKTIENAGLEAGVYSSRYWYYNNINVAELEDYHIWLAEYRDTPLYTGSYEMWQYTSSGSVNGIEGRVDLDIRYQ